MEKSRTRHDFIIKDLAISIPSAAGSGAGLFLPSDDGVEPPWWISPIASVLVKGDILEGVRATVKEALKNGRDLASIGRAFQDGDPDGNPSIRAAIHDIGAVVVASTAFAALGGGGGSVGLPNPECGGSSLETIPTPITPIVHVGSEVHRVTELPRLRKQLAVALETVDRLSAAQAPRGAEVAAVR